MSNNHNSIYNDDASVDKTEVVDGFCLRLSELIAAQNISQNEFARKLDAAPAYISGIVRGKSRPGLDFLKKVADTFSISLDWLVLGKGSMYGIHEIDKKWHEAVAWRIALAKEAASGCAEAASIVNDLINNTITPKSFVNKERVAAVLKSVQADANMVSMYYNAYLGLPNRELAAKELLAAVSKEFQSSSDDPLADLVNNFTAKKPQATPQTSPVSLTQNGTSNRAAAGNYYEYKSDK